MAEKAFMNWSGGKDSCLALHHILTNKTADVRYLVTTLNKEQDRISMHGVRNELLEMQAASIGITLHKILLPDVPTMASYESAMQVGMEPLLKEGLTTSIFGDIFLEDLRKYREEKSKAAGLAILFPLWNKPTIEIVKEFIGLGYKTIVVCVDATRLGKEFVGRIIDEQFLADLPVGVDPCGENGEFHTFVFEGPIFKQAIPFETGEIVHKTYQVNTTDDNDVCGDSSVDPHKGFWYIDLLPAV